MSSSSAQIDAAAAGPTPVEELLRRARGGDAAALDELASRYRQFVHLLVRSRCGAQLRARVDSSDLVQETLLRVAQHIAQFEGTCEEEWRAWLARVAENEVVHQLRHHLGAEKRDARRECRLAAPESSAGGPRLEQWWAKSQTSPSQAVVRKERVLALADALGRLPPDYREVLVLRHLEGLPFEAVAERLGRTSGAARVLWTRALKKLREELQTNGTAGEAPDV